MRRITFLLLTIILLASGNAFALPKTQAKQVTVDSSGILSSTNTNVQAVLEDLDDAIPGQATTTTVGTVRFATTSEVNAGTSAVSVISPAQLAAFAIPKIINITNHTVNALTTNSTVSIPAKTYTLSGFSGDGLVPSRIIGIWVDVLIRGQSNAGGGQSARLLSNFGDTTRVVCGASTDADNRSAAISGTFYIPVNRGQASITLELVNTLSQTAGRYFEYTIVAASQLGN